MADDVAEAFTRNAKVMKMLDTEKYDIAWYASPVSF